MSRNVLVQLVVSALVFFVAFRVLSFLGPVFVMLGLVGLVAWLVSRNPAAKAAVKGWAQNLRPSARERPQRPAPRSPASAPPPPDRPLTHEERAAFDDIVRGEDSDEGRGPRA